MKTLVRFCYTLVLSLSFGLASCVPIPDSELADRAAVISNTQDVSPVPRQPSQDITDQGTGRGSTKDKDGRLRIDDETAHRAIDGDPDTVWSSEQHATQWFSVAFDSGYLIDGVEMISAQFPSGPTTHEVWIENGSGIYTLSQRLVSDHTEDGQLLRIAIEPPQIAREVLVLTLESPSWVAWRELRVFGSPTLNAQENWEPRLNLAKKASGFELPVQVTHAGDGSGRIFVVEQKGRIHILEDGIVRDQPFLDITNRVSCCRERGLLNIAFSPSFLADQQFFVSYTDLEGTTIISRFTTSDDPNRAELDSEETLLILEQPHEIHNGGHLAFGPNDGLLYIGSGDGGHWYQEAGQDPTSLLGKILRIDVSGSELPYSVPSSNPFAQTDGFLGEIWALGIRNSWGFAFDRKTGDLFMPDVGHSKREEVNFQPASSKGGENYGWPFREGSICFEFVPCSQRVHGLTPPVAEYDHTQGCAIVGGVVYHGSSNPDLQGLFLFGDFCSGRIWGLRRLETDSQFLWQPSLLANALVPISSIGEDEEGNVYATGYQDGAIYMLLKN